MKVGDLIQMNYFDGLKGTLLLGMVIASGPVTYTVIWESGIKNKIRRDDRNTVAGNNIKLITDPEFLAEAKKFFYREPTREA